MENWPDEIENPPNERVRAALEELAAALQEQYGTDEVSGYGASPALRLDIGGFARPGGPETGICLWRSKDSCGVYTGNDDYPNGAPGSCTLYFRPSQT